jgi:hypothetical protein
VKLGNVFVGACALLLGLLGAQRAASFAEDERAAAIPAVGARLAPAVAATQTAIGRLHEQASREAEARRATELSAVPLRLVTRNGRVVAAPGGCRSLVRPWELLVFFHGAPTAVEPAFEQAELEGVLVVINLGIGSGPYEDQFKAAGSLSQLVERTASIVAQQCPGASSEVASIALGAWSAGYGAVYGILRDERAAARVDAVLLADGLHAGYVKDGRRKGVDPLLMDPFAELAEHAVAREKLFALTHTQIRTPDYASTSETADYLLQVVRLGRFETHQPGPRRDMWQTSYADGGAFHVRGYAGDSKQAHADHLLGIGRTLFPLLRDWRGRNSS